MIRLTAVERKFTLGRDELADMMGGGKVMVRFRCRGHSSSPFVIARWRWVLRWMMSWQVAKVSHVDVLACNMSLVDVGLNSMPCMRYSLQQALCLCVIHSPSPERHDPSPYSSSIASPIPSAAFVPLICRNCSLTHAESVTCSEFLSRACTSSSNSSLNPTRVFVHLTSS